MAPDCETLLHADFFIVCCRFGTSVFHRLIEPAMKKVIMMVFVMSGLISVAFSQRTSLDNYTGPWENAASWQGGVAPPVADPANITAAHLDLTINGYITRTGDIDIAGATNAEDFIINDTLVIIGNVQFNNDAAPLLIGPDAVLIVIGNISFGNNTIVENDGIFVVSGNATFANGASEVYDDSGGGELFVMGNVTDNPDASGADNWDQLDNIYPIIYDFTICEASGGSNCLLPIRLSYFEAALYGDLVELKWATTMEENFQKFIVQRSSDGTGFEDLGEVAGKGFDIYDIESRYSFEDKNPLIGFNYYRLKAVDLDDSYEYFGVLAVRFTAPKNMDVYPNPGSGEAISFSANFNPGESDRIILIDPLGVEILNIRASAVPDGMSFQEKLRSGVYILLYKSDDFRKTTRVLIKE